MAGKVHRDYLPTDVKVVEFYLHSVFLKSCLHHTNFWFVKNHLTRKVSAIAAQPLRDVGPGFRRVRLNRLRRVVEIV